MKLTTGILAIMVMAGSAGAQSPNIIQDTRDKLNAVQQQKAADTGAALDASGQAKPTPSKPAATTGKPVPSKPVTIPKAATVSVPNASPAKAKTTASTVAAKPVAVTVERTPVTPTPKTNQTTVQKSSMMPTQNPPAASPAKAVAGQKTSIMPVQKTTAPAASKASATPGSTTGHSTALAKPAPKTAEKTAPGKPVMVVVPQPTKNANKGAAKPVVQAGEKPPQEKHKYAMTGNRDPFVSPVVSHAGGSGCSTGKKCLEIAQISLKGVVRSDTGMIAVVTNSLNKAYFLRENDPVFNGYVEKITGDSITFKETVQDKLGKTFTRDVVKKILTPAV